MNEKSIGFVGGGRITRIFLEAYQRAHVPLGEVVVSDTNPEVLNQLKSTYPFIRTTESNDDVLRQEIIFLSLHPPVIKDSLTGVTLKDNAVLISLAPKLSISKLSGLLGGFSRIIRMIPNAPTYVNSGYNPLTFSAEFSEPEKQEFRKFFQPFGECPEVEESHLEAYAILMAMGPTYLWFQLFELEKIGISFGVGPEQVRAGLCSMLSGMARTMSESGLSPAEIMDLIPVKPLSDFEPMIKGIYHEKLEALHMKLKS